MHVRQFLDDSHTFCCRNRKIDLKTRKYQTVMRSISSLNGVTFDHDAADLNIKHDITESEIIVPSHIAKLAATLNS